MTNKRYKKAMVFSPVLRRSVEMTFYTDGRKNEFLKRVLWTLDGVHGYTMQRFKNVNGEIVWRATNVNCKF